MSREKAFWAKVGGRECLSPGGCWPWTGRPGDSGYAVTSYLGRRVRAHRLAYEICVGPIPQGLDLDHLCRNRACVNPAHLEPVTRRVNVLRGVGRTAINARKTCCLRGHDLSADNVYPRHGRAGRRCRACSVEMRARRIADGLPPGDKRHGTANAYMNFKCRCVPCKEAASAYFSARRRARI